MTTVESTESVDAAEPTASDLMFEAIMSKGYTFKQFSDITDTQLEAVYALAYRSFNSGKYDEAEKLLTWLMGLDHYDRRFQIALGCTRQKKKDYQGALNCFSVAALLDLNDPIPPLRSAECFLALGDQENAKSAALAVLGASKDDPKHEQNRGRASLILKGIENRAKKKSRKS